MSYIYTSNKKLAYSTHTHRASQLSLPHNLQGQTSLEQKGFHTRIIYAYLNATH